MKKRNIFICFIFTILMCFSLSFSSETKRAFAEGEPTEITITFNASGGTTDASAITMQPGETLDSLPTAQKSGFFFRGWSDGSNMILAGSTFSESIELYAIYVKKIYQYSITENEGILTIIAKTAESDFNYHVSSDCTDLQTALDLIKTDIDTPTDTATISLNNLTANQDINLSIQNVILTGTLNLSTYSILYTAPVSGASSLRLNDFTLNTTSSQDIVKVLGTNNSNIYISNAVFNSGSKNNNYSIYLESPIHRLIFENSLSYSSSYLYNYDNTNRQATFQSSFTLTSPSKILITIPYYVDEQPILQTHLTSDSFEFIPNQTNFTCSVKSKGTGQDYICASTKFNISFDENGGEILQDFTIANSQYHLLNQLNFPTESNYKKEHFYLEGFVGKITIDSTNWYFDATSLRAYLDDTSSPTYEEYFFSSIPEANSNAVGFTYYKYSYNASDINFLAVDFALKLNKTPSFVAIWKNIIYSITYVENEGSDVTDVNGIFNSSLTLPTSTRTGYDFIGWFTTPALAEEANESNIVNITTMPDTNQTLYAGWKIRDYTLSIYKNNQSAKVDKKITYGTLLNQIPELDPSSVTKTGYTFAGWFTDELLTTPLDETQTMPDEDFSVYASWTINQYTITLYLNHSTDDSIYKTATRNYRSNVTDLFAETPTFVGDTFLGWFIDKNGQYPFTNFPDMMPSENLTLYALWDPIEYRLTISYPALNDTEDSYLHYGDERTLLYPEVSGYIFEGWYVDENFTEALTLTTMPNRNLQVYAKYSEKKTISLDVNSQSYTKSTFKGFDIESGIDGFNIEYYVDGEWTNIAPTEKGTYDIRISRAEDSEYKVYIETFKSALVITAETLNVSIYSLILYCIATIELICAVIVLFIRKQRKTYLTYAIALPFGIIPTSQFVNLIVSLVLAVFGLVLLTMQLVKLKKLNNEILKISSENKEYSPPDVSENKSISQKVQVLLEQEGFVTASEVDDELDENDDELTLDIDKTKKETDDNDKFLSLEKEQDDRNNIE